MKTKIHIKDQYCAGPNCDCGRWPNMNNILGGKPSFINDPEKFEYHTGMEWEEGYHKGALVYPNGGYIFVLYDGEYNVMLDRSEYTSKNLKEIEEKLIEWYENEKGA